MELDIRRAETQLLQETVSSLDLQKLSILLMFCRLITSSDSCN
jgi:hypothetical protein